MSQFDGIFAFLGLSNRPARAKSARMSTAAAQKSARSQSRRAKPQNQAAWLKKSMHALKTGVVKEIEPIEYLPPGAIKLTQRDYDLDKLAGEDAPPDFS